MTPLSAAPHLTVRVLGFERDERVERARVHAWNRRRARRGPGLPR